MESRLSKDFPIAAFGRLGPIGPAIQSRFARKEVLSLVEYGAVLQD